MDKIERLNTEIGVLRQKEAGLQNRIRVLEAQRADLENAQIVQMVRKLRMTPAELAAFLDKHRNNLTNPTRRPSVTANQPKTESEENPQ